jgi:glutathione reductase (NADPH)
VDDAGRTTATGIRAIGDVTEHLMLTPLAVADGRGVVEDILGNVPARPDYGMVPTAAFTTPECGSVGMTEAEAAEAGIDHEVRRKSFSTLASAISARPGNVFMKAVVRAGDGKLLGLHFFGPHAAEATQMGAVALAAGLTEVELARTMPLHPSTAEEMIALGDPDGPLHPAADASRALAAE